MCHNIRINRCCIFEDKAFRGYSASKQEYFYGIKVTVITNLSGYPIKMMIIPGREHDLPMLKILDPKNLPLGSALYGDAAYSDYEYEDSLETDGFRLAVNRKGNATRPYKLEDYVNLRVYRKTIERTFSTIMRFMPKRIHAVCAHGFELKVVNFVIAAATIFLF